MITLCHLLAGSVSAPTTKLHKIQDQAHINKMMKDAFLCLWVTTLWRSPHKVTLYLLQGSTPIQWALWPRVWSVDAVGHSEWLCFNNSKNSQSGHLFLLQLPSGLQHVMVHFQPAQNGVCYCPVSSAPDHMDVSWLSTFSKLPSSWYLGMRNIPLESSHRRKTFLRKIEVEWHFLYSFERFTRGKQREAQDFKRSAKYTFTW